MIVVVSDMHSEPSNIGSYIVSKYIIYNTFIITCKTVIKLNHIFT